ncbi:aldolase/citrate lyase family protein [Kutzneria viridogrisea]|uniref:Citrate lyase beta subunit n=1 Tax=Kutzneria viridogrisea TaxID=47990 RepID=A0ABR6BC88_9PSEU|nr:citrate lyase beta subunit [Kutzneria viridogrisea]
MADLDRLTSALDLRLSEVDEQRNRLYPGDPGGRQPVHTVYVPADRATPDLITRWGQQALAVLDEHAPDAAALTAATGVDAGPVYERVRAKLVREPIEDLRIDFEDGYGNPGEEVEDAHVLAAATVLRAGATPFCGVRVKGMEPAVRRRGVRTLSLLLDALAEDLPAGFVITLPKVTSVEQVEAMVWLCEQLEAETGLAAGRLRFELQVETTQAVLGADGTATVARMVHASGGRCTGLHYGTYDYSAACGVTAAHQAMDHPVADHAKAVMLLAAAATGVRLSDGSTNVLPIGEQVHAAWRLHAGLVQRSLRRGYYQGWDLHAHQLPTRYLATFAFFREAFPQAAARLKAYLGNAGGSVLDEPATAQGLCAALVRGLDCGALDADEVQSAVGVSRAVLDGYARRRVG